MSLYNLVKVIICKTVIIPGLGTGSDRPSLTPKHATGNGRLK